MTFMCPTSVQARTLWLGEIEHWMDESIIIQNFMEYGYKVKSVKIIRDKSTKSIVGYGFIEFESPDVAKEVLNNLNGKLIPDTKKTFKLNPASYSAGKVASMGNFPKNEYPIYVGDLDQSVTEEKLRDYFLSKYKSVIGTKIVIDNITKESKGYGFVKFNDPNESNKAIEEMNGKYWNGRPIKVNQASFKKTNELTASCSVSDKNLNDLPLSQNTMKNLNNFYIQNTTDGQNSFNLFNFYENHSKYFFRGNNYAMNNINNCNMNMNSCNIDNKIKP